MKKRVAANRSSELMGTAEEIPTSFEEAEIIFGLVYALGTEVDPVISVLEDYIKRFEYSPHSIRISDYLKRVRLPSVKKGNGEYGRMQYLIDKGNVACEKAHHKDFLALAAVSEISNSRELDPQQKIKKPHLRKAHILRSLKRPEEVYRLRQIYRPGFFLIGIFASEKERLEYLTTRKNLNLEDARRIMQTDQNDEIEFGQRTRDTFHLADVFVQTKDALYKRELERFLDLVFGEKFITPKRDEYGMFIAASAASRSAQFGRQVGAAVLTQDGDVLSVGCNEVPRAGGGSYWPEDPDDYRDHVRKRDSNDEIRTEIENSILDRLQPFLDKTKPLPSKPGILRGTKLSDITEYGRAVHAEMDAILGCARVGVSPKGAVLYTTTFPCHNCARHIVAAGISHVVYVEPYPKSRARDLHSDAIDLGENDQDQQSPDKQRKIPFAPFVGIGPRRYLDLFSMDLSSGRPRTRKIGGAMVHWNRARSGGPRIPMIPTSYLEREELASHEIYATMEELERREKPDEKKPQR